MNRRDLFRGCWNAAFAAPVAQPARRLERHRNLFTGDSCVYFYNPELWQPEGLPYTAKAIHRYVDLLADSGVDTFRLQSQRAGRLVSEQDNSRP